MTAERTGALVVGGGQAGLAVSAHLKRHGLEHLVLERGRIAERWRSGRWDSLVANGPAWHDRFPELEFAATGADGFPPKEEVADYFVSYAQMMALPVREGVEVLSVRKAQGRPGFLAETSQGAIHADQIIAATGPFQRPVFPSIVPKVEGLLQIHSFDYRNPQQLPNGAVLVVGSGSSGAQVADELRRSGRRVYLSVGAHERPPRSYRGRDYCWWLGVLGKWDLSTPSPETAHVTISVSGAEGGKTVDFRRFAAEGMTLAGTTQDFDGGFLRFAPDLKANLDAGDRYYRALLDECDAFAERNGLDLPEEPEARTVLPDPECVSEPITRLNLAEAGISTILWATGYALDFSWLQADAFDESGKPCHRRGVSSEPGVYFLGLPWLSRRGSSFIWGVWHDAKYIADHIETQNRYLAYHKSRG